MSSLLRVLTAVIAFSAIAVVSAQQQPGSVYNYDDAGTFGPGRVAKVCTPPSGAPICYKNQFGNFYYDCDPSLGERVRIYQCTDVHCTVACILQQTWYNDGNSVRSFQEGYRNYQWTGDFYAVPDGYITIQQFNQDSVTPCADLDMFSADYQPASASVCLDDLNGGSMMSFCNGGNPTVKDYYPSTTCSGDNYTQVTQPNGLCTDGNRIRWACGQPASGTTEYAVVFWRATSGVGAIASVAVTVLMITMALTSVM